jgi:hypothetical protein
VLDVVLVLHVHPGHADAAALLLAVGRERQRLDVAGVRDRDDHLLVGDQVLDVDLVLGVGDLRAAVVAVAIADLEQLLADQAHDLGLVAEDVAQPGDPLDDVGVLGLDLVRLERGEALQAQVEDRLRLCARQLEALDQAVAATSGSLEARISSMTSSMFSIATSRPSRMWRRASFSRSSYFVRRTMMSVW